MNRRRRTDTAWRERGVSDVLGFAVVFGIVILAISLFYTFGTAALADLQHDHAMDNAERAFDIIDDNMADIHRNDAPGRATELQFARGELALSGTTTIQVTNATDVQGPPVSVVAAATPLHYTSRDTAFHYAGGAVVRTDRRTAGMVNEPPFDFGPDRTVISLVETIPRGDGTSLGGGGSAHVSARNGGSTLERVVDRSLTVEVTVSTPRYRAWARYFRSQPWGTVSVDEDTNTVTYSLSTDALFVRRTQIGVGVTA